MPWITSLVLSFFLGKRPINFCNVHFYHFFSVIGGVYADCGHGFSGQNNRLTIGLHPEDVIGKGAFNNYVNK